MHSIIEEMERFMKDKKSTQILEDVVGELASCYQKNEIFTVQEGVYLPSRKEIIEFIKELRRVIFPGYFDDKDYSIRQEYFLGYEITCLYTSLKLQLEAAFRFAGMELDRVEEVCRHFFASLPKVQALLLKDVEAGFEGDPAAKSKSDIIYSYPGLFAIYVYRMAHVLYEQNVPLIPRIMTEYAHGKTGIDINPGATIGEYFFIDHGTGVVIGETTEIGKWVKLYQGVTLGALSTRSGQKLRDVKRHPTIEDKVTIYSNASVLGGETVIGEGCVIGGSAFITASVPPFTRVNVKSPEHSFKEDKKDGGFE